MLCRRRRAANCASEQLAPSESSPRLRFFRVCGCLKIACSRYFTRLVAYPHVKYQHGRAPIRLGLSLHLYFLHQQRDDGGISAPLELVGWIGALVLFRGGFPFALYKKPRVSNPNPTHRAPNHQLGYWQSRFQKGKIASSPFNTDRERQSTTSISANGRGSCQFSCLEIGDYNLAQPYMRRVPKRLSGKSESFECKMGRIDFRPSMIKKRCPPLVISCVKRLGVAECGGM